MNTRTIEITSTDGTVETRRVDKCEFEEGVLSIWQENAYGRRFAHESFVLAHVKSWKWGDE